MEIAVLKPQALMASERDDVVHLDSDVAVAMRADLANWIVRKLEHPKVAPLAVIAARC